MKLGETANEEMSEWGKPLDGIRILAVEQMQALPYATQLLARLGAEVVKVEHPKMGESGRSSAPSVEDPDGRKVGVTYLRNNLNKKSLGIDIKSEKGRELILELAGKFDVFAENFKSNTMSRLGLAYEDVLKSNPKIVYLSVSGFGNTVETPYDGWPAYAGVAEAMSSLYSWSTPPEKAPPISPMGALGDTCSAVFGAMGVLAALRQRDKTGQGQYVDISMFDCMVALADVQIQYDSMSVEREPGKPGLLILDAFKAADGFFMIQIGREHQWESLCRLIGKADWLTDEKFATRQSWVDYLESDIRPAIEEWAEKLDKLETCQLLAEAGIAAGPCNSPKDVVGDKHINARNMVVDVGLPDGSQMTIPGNPIKISGIAEGPETRVPWLNENTDEILQAELGLTDEELQELRAKSVIG